jgi:hypothetical protein
MGKEGQTVPEMKDDWVNTISARYIELYERVIGEPFRPQPLTDEETYQRVSVFAGEPGLTDYCPAELPACPFPRPFGSVNENMLPLPGSL